jgi:GNAT superfamily N-acetyltransferase
MRIDSNQAAGDMNLEELTLEARTYPLPPATQAELIQLWRTEWHRTDYDWLEALNGDYSEHLVITSVLGRYQGEPVATATVLYAQQQPQVALLGNVLTHHTFRRQGFAGQVIEAALAVARGVGCAACFLGTQARPRNVYLQHGFVWHTGVVMRKTLREESFERSYFAAGQPAAIRAAHWGDLPGVTLLVVQPLATACLDYPRGLLSGRYAPVERCVSNFPVLWHDTVLRGGTLSVLAEPQKGRIFGFASVTRGPGPARRHTAVIELVAEDHYEAHLPAMLEHLLHYCRECGVQDVEVYVTDGDTAKARSVSEAGFTPVARLSGAIRLSDGTRDVVFLRKRL